MEGEKLGVQVPSLEARVLHGASLRKERDGSEVRRLCQGSKKARDERKAEMGDRKQGLEPVRFKPGL